MQLAGQEAEPVERPALREVQPLRTRLHPRDPHLEDLASAAEYPHRYNTRPEDSLDQVEWLERDAATGSTTWRTPVAHRLRSLNSREACYLNITNSTPHAVRMLWIDYQGNEVAYELIGPGEVLRQQTFLTHPWVVRETTTASRLLLNGREAFVPSRQEHREQVAQARARQQALQQQAQQAAGAQGQQQGGQAVALGAQGVGPGAGLGQQLLVLAGQGAGWALFEVTVQELPQLLWTKEMHALFPGWFKRSTWAFLLCHQKQQRELYGSAADGQPCLGHLPTELLPLIVGMAAPEVPQGVHFPPAGRLDIKPARLPAAPPASAAAAGQQQQQPGGGGVAGNEQGDD